MALPPLHLAIIPDGNRRWARQRALAPWLGHQQAIENSRSLIDWCYQHPRIATVTFWGFSTENWQRRDEEIKHLMRLYEQFLRQEREKFNRNKTRLAHSGRLDRIPPSLARLITDLSAETADYTTFTLNFALDYSGKDEIIRAVHRLSDLQAVTEENFRQYLDQPALPDIDLVIRTSGEQRTSGFALWQSAYAEWIFVPKFYPDFSVADLEQALTQYGQRARRFGT
ncbi:MAG: polyprenyl diphosphate synthase [Candidatus Andersenbacteria bacterium]